MFKPKYDLPPLESYEGEAPKEFWDKFPSHGVNRAGGTVNGYALEHLATQCGYPDLATLAAVVRDLKRGAVIGCTGEFRNPGRARNAPSALTEGRKVTDCIADWVAKGYAKGPFPESQVPKTAKFSGLMARPKPNGAVRVIMNLSAPKGSSVNEGIDSDAFPTSMSSTTKWLAALHRAGKSCKMVKVDWSDAYKHVPVCEEDSNLQWFSWLQKSFKETRLVFGGASSAGIFDRLNKIVIFVVAHRAKMDSDQICQVLDDCCACAPAGSQQLEVFDQEFAKVAGLLGIKLAPRDDPEKSFAPCTEGVVLGVRYDTVNWSWGIPEEKLCRFLHNADNLLDSDTVSQKTLWSFIGKLLHLAPLVPGGRFNLYHLLKVNSLSEDPEFSVPLGDAVKRQVTFWKELLQVCSDVTSIPNPSAGLPPWAIEVYTDAAGGTTRNPGRGVGAVTVRWWVYQAWGRKINAGGKTPEGKGLDRSMSALELVGPLLALCAAARFCRGGAMRFWVDNAGSVFIWKKGYSTKCVLSSTLVTALDCVAAGLGCRVEVVKVGRCSSGLASMADALSKADFARFRSLAEEEANCCMPLEPLAVPEALARWIAAPKEDWELGRSILQELAAREPMLGF